MNIRIRIYLQHWSFSKYETYKVADSHVYLTNDLYWSELSLSDEKYTWVLIGLWQIEPLAWHIVAHWGWRNEGWHFFLTFAGLHKLVIVLGCGRGKVQVRCRRVQSKTDSGPEGCIYYLQLINYLSYFIITFLKKEWRRQMRCHSLLEFRYMCMYLYVNFPIWKYVNKYIFLSMGYFHYIRIKLNINSMGQAHIN